MHDPSHRLCQFDRAVVANENARRVMHLRAPAADVATTVVRCVVLRAARASGFPFARGVMSRHAEYVAAAGPIDPSQARRTRREVTGQRPQFDASTRVTRQTLHRHASRQPGHRRLDPAAQVCNRGFT
jgi:hypothetical protein